MNAVEAHYAQPGLRERVRAALRESGLTPDCIAQSDLAKLDQFHVGGLDATISLARLAGIQQSDRVLDLGSGAGGPSRHLASAIGCHVTGIDLTEEYCQVATMLAVATRLSHLVSYQHGDALDTPFEDAAFDVVWTQHAAMNIEDKPGLYREAFRVLRPGGRFVLHDIVRGTGEVRYPVPWARHADVSFLVSAQELQSGLQDAGGKNVALRDVTEKGLETLKLAASRTDSPGYGLRTLVGPEFPAMVANLAANLQTGACRVVQAVCTY